MPKRISAIDRKRLSLAHIVQRLPLHRQLSASNAAVIKITPVWQRWSQSHLAEEFRDQVQLSCVNTDELVLTCPHAICASQLKHRKQNLLSYLQNSEASGVERIKIRIAKANNSGAEMDSSNVDASHKLGSSASYPATQPQPHDRLRPTTTNRLRPTTTNSLRSTTTNSLRPSTRTAPSKESVQSIESCQKTVSNPRLADSLNQLASTLKERASNNSSE